MVCHSFAGEKWSFATANDTPPFDDETVEEWATRFGGDDDVVGMGHPVLAAMTDYRGVGWIVVG